MVDEKTLRSVAEDLAITNVRRYVAMYVPGLDDRIVDMCDESNPVFANAMDNYAKIIRTVWNDALEQECRAHELDDELIVREEFSAFVLRSPVVMLLDSSCLNAAAISAFCIITGKPLPQARKPVSKRHFQA